MSLRVAMLSVHTSPLHRPGTGDAGGMNVYMVELARALARRDVSVDLFTRCRGEGHSDDVQLDEGVRVRHLHAGPCEPLPKESMRDLLLEFSLALIRAGAERPYDLVHSHYWLSGQVGGPAAGHWRVPLVHTMHTLAKVKNSCLAPTDTPEPEWRISGEAGVVRIADRLIANTADEAAALVGMYGADQLRTDVVSPGVNTRIFRPGGGSSRPGPVSGCRTARSCRSSPAASSHSRLRTSWCGRSAKRSVPLQDCEAAWWSRSSAA